MDMPICFSQFFVNKQNLRSFGAIIPSNVLKNETLFLQHVLQDIEVSDLSSDLLKILQVLRENLRNKSKEDFSNYFPATYRCKHNELTSASKANVITYCWNALSDIVPSNFFGNSVNAKLFRNLVQKIVCSMKREHMMFTKLLQKWNISTIPWKCLPEEKSKKILYIVLVWIFKNVLSAIISLNFYVTTCKLNADEYKLHYFWKNQWQSFYDRKISDMNFIKIIKKYEPYYLGKKIARKQSLAERIKLKMLKQHIPKLYLILKPNNNYRPIVCYKNDILNSVEKNKIKEKLKCLKILAGTQEKRIEDLFINFYHKWVNLKRPKLYFIKTDLSNAFGSINREKLMKILHDRHLNFQKTEKDVLLKRKIARQYKEMVAELRKPLLVRAGFTVYEWKEGLLQGYKFSPALSELYYSSMDKIYFIDHIKQSDNELKLFLRVVDDYLYITDSIQDANNFLEALSNYRNVNYDKTIVNFPHKTIKFREVINFLGYSYNTSNLQVGRAGNVFHGQMCYKIAFTSAIFYIHKFLENRIGQSGIPVNGHIFNFHHNSEKTIWSHVFTTFCLSANKFCTILAILCKESDICNYLILYKKRVSVKLCNAILETLMKNKPADYMFLYCINHFRYLSFMALYLCAKQTSYCSGLIPLIRDELAKCNCIFGKWKEHASRINRYGNITKRAVKGVCRRTELRMLMKTFESLPDGFQCFKRMNCI